MAVSNGITSAPKGSEPPAQLARRAADAVRDMIRRGDLLPGEKVHQVDVAKIAGVSRSPLREALRTLEAEGLVRYESNRGYVVSRLRLEELAELYELRSLIETEIIASIKKPSAGVIRRMERYVAAMEAAVERNDFPSIAEAYRGFRSQTVHAERSQDLPARSRTTLADDRYIQRRLRHAATRRRAGSDQSS